MENELIEVQEMKTEAQDALEIVQRQREKDLAEIAESEAFTVPSQLIHAREVANILHKKDLEIQDEEISRQWDMYLLGKKKEELAYKAKKEKGIVKQKVKANVKKEKRDIAMIRYGHLYEKDENGEYKDFTVSTFINRYKEFANWYQSLTENTRKVINSSIKFIFRTGLTVGLVYLAYRALQILAKSGVLILGG